MHLLNTLTRSAVVAIILAALVTFLPGVRRIQKAEAIGSTMSSARFAGAALMAQAADDCGGSTRIVQECPLAGLAGIRSLEQQVIADVLAMYNLPERDAPQFSGAAPLNQPTNATRLLYWERDLLRTLLFDRLAVIVEKSPHPRTDEEREQAERSGATARTLEEEQIVEALAAKVQQQRLRAATEAKRFYEARQRDPCGFKPPAPLTYEPPQSCFVRNPIGNVIDTPPTFEQFQQYGVASAYGRFQTDTELQTAAADASKAYGFLGGAGLAGVAAISAYSFFAATSLGSSLAAAILPFAGVAEVVNAATGVVTFTPVAPAGVAAAGAFAGAIAVIVVAVVTAIITALEVFTAAETPAKLDAAIAAAQTPPDLRTLIASEEGKREIFSAYLLTTATDFRIINRAATIPPAPLHPARFLIDPGSNEHMSEELTYTSWDRGGRARIAHGWFVDQDAGTPFATLGIDYINHDGEHWTAWLIGDRFLHTNAGTAKPAFMSDSISYQDERGFNRVATYVPPGVPVLNTVITNHGVVTPGNTPPAFAGSVANVEVDQSSADGAVVTFDLPSATDADGPAPVVRCDPAPGSTFPVGTTTVTCTATDEAGAIATLRFTVTVRSILNTPLERLYNPQTGDHFYTTDADERDRATRQGYVFEWTEALVSPSAASYLAPLYRLWNGRDHFYTIDTDERDQAMQQHGYSSEGIAAYVSATALDGTVPLYRLWNPQTGDHLYTINAGERDRAVRDHGYTFERVEAYVAPAPR